MTRSTSLWTLFRAFAPFWSFLLVFKFASGLHYSLLSPLGSQLMPIWVVGLLMGGASLVQLMLDVPAGHLLDRFGYRRLLILTSFTFFVAALCLFLEFTLVTYLLSLVLSIFGWLFFGPGTNAYLLSSAPHQQAGRFMSLRDVFGSVGIVLSSALLPLVLLLSPSHMGLVLALSFAVAIAAILFAPMDRRSVHHVEQKLPTHFHYIRRRVGSSFKMIKKLNPASGTLLLLSTASGIFYGMIWFVVPLVLLQETDNFLLGIGLGVFDFSIVVLGFLLGNLADRSDKRTLVFFGLLIFALFGMLLGSGFGFSWLFILFGFLATAGDEMAGISLWSWLHSLDKDHAHDGAVASIITLFEDLGWMIGPALAGVLYTFIGPSWTVAVGALPLFALWFVYWTVFQKHMFDHIHFSLIPAKPHKRRHKV